MESLRVFAGVDFLGNCDIVIDEGCTRSKADCPTVSFLSLTTRKPILWCQDRMGFFIHSFSSLFLRRYSSNARTSNTKLTDKERITPSWHSHSENRSKLTS